MRQLLQRLRERRQALDREIDSVSAEIHEVASDSELCRRVATAPGAGPIIASTMVAAIGSGQAFGKGRDLAAWLGLVPKQYSTGGKSNLGGISKRGNSYLRMLLIQGARALM
ncbi:transposase [Ralstonia sp. UBA689]|uniref:transposase n=1 Tax=Ralstonia sp. UBA689 TaxID=1947373 RepID=UPI0039C9BF22